MAEVTEGQIKTTMKLLFLKTTNKQTKKNTTVDKVSSSNKNLSKDLCSGTKEK